MNSQQKCFMFNDDKYFKRGRAMKSLLDQVNENIPIENFCSIALSKEQGLRKMRPKAFPAFI